MKILNLYAGIGGNRKLWPEGCQVIAVENNPQIAELYKRFFPEDTVIVGDAHEYLLEHYQEFDFIWSSPPCPTHGQFRFRTRVLAGTSKALYPDMTLYQEIIFLKHHFKGKWVVENVEPYYEPLLPGMKAGRHLFWANFNVTSCNIRTPKNLAKMTKEELQEHYGFKFEENIYLRPNHCERHILRNCVHPELGLHVFRCAWQAKQQVLVAPITRKGRHYHLDCLKGVADDGGA